MSYLSDDRANASIMRRGLGLLVTQGEQNGEDDTDEWLRGQPHWEAMEGGEVSAKVAWGEEEQEEEENSSAP